MPKHVRKKCFHPGCNNGFVQGGRCIAHGARRKGCAHPGCVKTVKPAGLCSMHGPSRRKCDEVGCDLFAQQGGRCRIHSTRRKGPAATAAAASTTVDDDGKEEELGWDDEDDSDLDVGDDEKEDGTAGSSSVLDAMAAAVVDAKVGGGDVVPSTGDSTNKNTTKEDDDDRDALMALKFKLESVERSRNELQNEHLDAELIVHKRRNDELVEENRALLERGDDKNRLMAMRQASRQMPSISAQLAVDPSSMSLNISRSTETSMGILVVCILRISRMEDDLGWDNRTCSSKRPGLSSAASIASSLFVAATTKTLCSPLALLIPSISFSRVVKILDCTPEVTSESPPSRFAASASNSSKKRMQGDAALAR
jgi:hypothetical protein